jgi:integrase
LPSFAISVLGRHRDRQGQEKQFVGEGWKEHGLMFPSTVGTPLEPRNLVRHFHTKLAALKIPRHPFHDLRHTAASLLLAQGVTLHEVKENLGHSQISLTAILYGHTYTTVLRSAVEKMESVLAPAARLAPSVAPSPIPTRPN